jgi:hypothetical protein
MGQKNNVFEKPRPARGDGCHRYSGLCSGCCGVRGPLGELRGRHGPADARVD